MDLTWTIEYAVRAGRVWVISFIWLLPLTGFGAAESGVNSRVLRSFIVVLTLVLVASWLAIAVLGFGGSGVAGAIASTSKPAILSRAKTGHKCGEGCHGLRLFLAEVSGEPFVSDTMLEGYKGFGV